MNMKKILLIMAGAVMLSGIAMAQQNSLQKTAWKVVTIHPDGHVSLQKTEWANLKNAQPKYHYIQFDANGEYHRGTNCFGEQGHYELNEEQVLQISGMDAVMASDCKEPEPISGNYRVKIKGSNMELYPEAPVSNEEPYATAEDVAAAAAQTAEAAATSTEAEATVVDAAAAYATDQPYAAVQNWLLRNFDDRFFRAQGAASGTQINLLLRFDHKGRATVEDIEGTKSEKLKQAIKAKVARMPLWSAEDATYGTAESFPLLYINKK